MSDDSAEVLVRLRAFTNGRNIQIARGSTPVQVPNDDILFPLFTAAPADEKVLSVRQDKHRQPGGDFKFSLGVPEFSDRPDHPLDPLLKG